MEVEEVTEKDKQWRRPGRKGAVGLYVKFES
jgi:hypothetical protein